jgi:Rod binding domain-containing protein
MEIVRGLPPPPEPARAAGAPRDPALLAAARELEEGFLAEMLKSAGLGTLPGSFGGGVGEEQFGSLLRLEQARKMVDQGGLGLAESLYEALKEIPRDRS